MPDDPQLSREPDPAQSLLRRLRESRQSARRCYPFHRFGCLFQVIPSFVTCRRNYTQVIIIFMMICWDIFAASNVYILYAIVHLHSKSKLHSRAISQLFSDVNVAPDRQQI